jgi:hypothetical protein
MSAQKASIRGLAAIGSMFSGMGGVSDSRRYLIR